MESDVFHEIFIIWEWSYTGGGIAQGFDFADITLTNFVEHLEVNAKSCISFILLHNFITFMSFMLLYV